MLAIWDFPVIVVIETSIAGITRPAVATAAVITAAITAVIASFAKGMAHTETLLVVIKI